MRVNTDIRAAYSMPDRQLCIIHQPGLVITEQFFVAVCIFFHDLYSLQVN